MATLVKSWPHDTTLVNINNMRYYIYMPPKPTCKVVIREGQRGARIDPKGCKVRTSVNAQGSKKMGGIVTSILLTIQKSKCKNIKCCGCQCDRDPQLETNPSETTEP